MIQTIGMQETIIAFLMGGLTVLLAISIVILLYCEFLHHQDRRGEL